MYGLLGAATVRRCTPTLVPRSKAVINDGAPGHRRARLMRTHLADSGRLPPWTGHDLLIVTGT
jgi:hypothetical protein